jgi:gamma-glutamylaminecyclotransferase
VAALDAKKTLLFDYGSLLPGERDHELLAGAHRVGPACTPPEYYLVELNAFPALVRGGRIEVKGELYEVDAATLLSIDLRKENPVLFKREAIRLAGGELAEAYLMTLDQVRGRRRLNSGDWRARFNLRRSGIPESRWAEWARGRSPKR